MENEKRGPGQPPKGAGGKEARRDVSLRLAPSSWIAIKREAKRRGISVPDLVEEWAEGFPKAVVV